MGARGRFIVLEGGEGSGKSTQARLLAAALGADLTREPGGTSIGEAVRAVLLDRRHVSLQPRTELLLMVAARAQHVAERIAPLLNEGRDVVCDRFTGSTIAYQGFGRGLPLEEVADVCAIAEQGCRPDLTVLLDVPSELAQSRRSGARDRIEAADEAFHERVVAGFRRLAQAHPEDWVVVDGTGPIEEVTFRVGESVSVFLS